MISLDQLLQPVREEAPCGDDPWAAGLLSELETAIQGKPETQFSAAEEPDWPRLRKRALEIAGAAKDLRVGAILTATLLRTDGLAGLAAGLKLIRGYVERYWETVFPLLDVADGNDPMERINALANLAAPLGTDGDVLKVIPSLRRLPLLAAPRSGRFSLEHYRAVREQTSWPEEAGPAPTAALLAAAKQEVGHEVLGELVQSAREIVAELDAIENLFRDKAGPALYPAFESLRRELQLIDAWLGEGRPAAEAATRPAPVDAAAAAEPAGPGWSGTVRNREDVLQALAAVIDYYRRCEPSSPIPFLLQRAARIVPMDFLAVMNELTPEAREKIITLVGEVTPASPS